MWMRRVNIENVLFLEKISYKMFPNVTQFLSEK